MVFSCIGKEYSLPAGVRTKLIFFVFGAVLSRAVLFALGYRSAMNDDILTWRIGDVTVTSVPESSDPTSPKFMFSSIDKTGVLDLKRKSPWLEPFVGEKGHLLQKIQIGRAHV